jgi:hypothetical protein
MGKGAGDAETEVRLGIVVFPSAPEAKHRDPGSLRRVLECQREIDDSVPVIAFTLAATVQQFSLLHGDMTPKLRVDQSSGGIDRDAGDTVRKWVHGRTSPPCSTHETALDQRQPAVDSL